MRASRFALTCGLATAALTTASASAEVIATVGVTPTGPFAVQTVPTVSTSYDEITGNQISRDDAQTFVVDESITLDAISVVFLNAQGDDLDYVVRLYEVPANTTPDNGPPPSYPIPSVEFEAESTLLVEQTLTTSEAYTAVGSTNTFLRFDFTDADAVQLDPGTLYQFQVTDGVYSGPGTNPNNIFGLRVATDDPYAGGFFYTSNDDSGNPLDQIGRDLIMYVEGTPVPEPTSLAGLGLLGLAALRRRRA